MVEIIEVIVGDRTGNCLLEMFQVVLKLFKNSNIVIVTWK